MYYTHFGLSEAPFRITPNTEVFFAGGNRGAILDALIYAISQGEGIIKVTGEVGTGKTMLCNMLQSRLPPQVETVYLAHPSVSPEEILHAIAFELQLQVQRDASRMEVMHALYAYLLERHAKNKQVVIFIEESQNMPIATLEEVRLLSNLETGKHKLLQIVLFGQPELDDNLRQPNIRQLRERITHSFALPPLAAPEVGEYLMFRMRAVGYRGPDIFSPGVVKRIAQASEGLTRRVNLIADKALLAAFSENTHTILPRHVAAAIRDSEFARDSSAKSTPRTAWWIGIGAAAIVAIVIGALAWVNAGSRPGAPVSGEVQKPTAPGNPAQASAPQPTRSAAAAPAPAAPSSAADEKPTALPISAQAETPSAAVVAVAQQETPPPVLPQTPQKSERAPQTLAEQSDMLETRLRLTLEWLRSSDPETLSIQLLGSENPQQLRDHLSTIAKSIEISNIFVYRTLAKQKPFLTVLYGTFSTREAAQSALDRLPTHLKAFKPYLRTVQGIREEMSRNNTL
jgi:MSHA biogenesis protein MshM